MAAWRIVYSLKNSGATSSAAVMPTFSSAVALPLNFNPDQHDYLLGTSGISLPQGGHHSAPPRAAAITAQRRFPYNLSAPNSKASNFTWLFHWGAL
jgi:hypothetical protein